MNTIKLNPRIDPETTFITIIIIVVIVILFIFQANK